MDAKKVGPEKLVLLIKPNKQAKGFVKSNLRRVTT